MSAGKSITVYGLASSHDGVIRYIGQTSKSLNQRLAWHIAWINRDDSRRSRWIRAVLARGSELTIAALETNAALNIAEVRWIAHYRSLGADLVNSTDGGDGGLGFPKTAAHRQKISAALTGKKSPWTAERNRRGKGKPGHPSTPETNAKIAADHRDRAAPWVVERNRNIVWTDEMRAKVSAANSGRVASATTKQLLSAMRKGKPWTQARRDACRKK